VSAQIQEVVIRPRGNMHFAFILSMPSNNSWNGRWTGEEQVWARVKSFSSRDFKEKLVKLVGDHRYAFGDGWVACVTVEVVEADEKRKLLKKSAGFCGYDWMINSLIDHGEIRT
jgi:hypothetical protein